MTTFTHNLMGIQLGQPKRVGWFGRIFRPATRTEKFHQFLQTTFDSSWTLFENVQLPDDAHDALDAVLVGKHGIFAVEARGDSNNHRFRDRVWRTEVAYGRKWKTGKWNPVDQAELNAQRLETHLAQRLEPIAVLGRVFWAGSGMVDVSAENQTIWLPKHQAAIKHAIATQPALTAAQIKQIRAEIEQLM